MKGKNRVSKRYRKKQQNVVDDKKMRAKILKEEAEKRKKRMADGSGDGPEGGGVMPGRTAGAASDAPVAPEGISAALRRFYKQ
jgi:U3 small nucleolar RNA-associated protein 7